MTSFRLESLTAANGIEHSGAHDALADVQATIALARLLRDRQPRLFDFALGLRSKPRVEELLAPRCPLLHVSARYPAALGCIAPVLPLARHPTVTNGVIVYDLRQDPTALLDLEVETIRTRLFTRVADLPEGCERIALKTLHVNRAPVLAPMKTLSTEAAERWSINQDKVAEHSARLKAAGRDLEDKVRAVHAERGFAPETDPDLMIYSGGFFSNADRREMERIRTATPAELAKGGYRLQDPRLTEMLFRLRARNWPESLSAAERDDWEAFRRRRLTDPAGGGSLTLGTYRETLARLNAEHAADPDRLAVLAELAAWGDGLLPTTD